MFFSYGTAYRLTKRGGDNGVALYGWIFALSFASLVPGLGFYLWKKYKDEDEYIYTPPSSRPPAYSSLDRPPSSSPTPYSNRTQDLSVKKECRHCHTLYNEGLNRCPSCGAIV